jgi:integrase
VSEPIRKITLGGGKIRYRCVVDIGYDPSTRQRKQLTKTFNTKKEGQAWLASIRVDVAKGTLIGRDRSTLSDYLADWLAGRTDVKPSTRDNYENALKIPMKKLGGRLLQEVTKADFDRMVAGMRDGSLRTQGNKGAPLSPRTVALTLTVLDQAFASAVAEGRLPRNVVRLVKRPANKGSERTVWEADQIAAFLTTSDANRIGGAWRLSLSGLRRGEVLGLTWKDIDFDKAEVFVHASRVMVGSRAVLQPDTKTNSSVRTVPLTPDALTALGLMRTQQSQERLMAGSAYDDCGLVVVNALGTPVKPRWYSDTFKMLSAQAGVPVARLHDARHAYGSHLLHQGVSIALVSLVMGHASVEITARIYAHALKEGAGDRVRNALVAAGL